MENNNNRYTVLPRVLVFVFKKDKLLLMKYSGQGGNMNQEKIDRRGIYNCIGGHVEKGEDVIASAVKEAREKAGIGLVNPKLKGVVNVSGFAGKDIVNFIVMAGTDDEPVQSTLEGELEWVGIDKLNEFNIIKDLSLIIEKLLSLKSDEIIVGSALFDGKFEPVKVDLKVA